MAPDTVSAGSPGSPGSADEFQTYDSVWSFPQKVGSAGPIFGKNSFWTLPGLKTQNHEEINFLYIQLENQVFQKTLTSECKKQGKIKNFRKTRNDPTSIPVILNRSVGPETMLKVEFFKKDYFRQK